VNRSAAESWTPEIAEDRARDAGIFLTEQHWRVIAACRELAAHDGIRPDVEQIAVITHLTAPQIVTLFAGRPAEMISRIAGLEQRSNR
jgi:tRNA 2-thiouridine synthesizing protein E